MSYQICYLHNTFNIRAIQKCKYKYRAVANGPVGPAMAGPIIAVVVFNKKKINIFFRPDQ